MAHRLVLIDDLTRSDHYYLSKEDRCYYVMEYTSGQDYRFSKANSLIKNFKKSLDRKHLSEWIHKGRAIKEIGLILKEIFPQGSLDDITIVPVPPSKCKNDPLYDDRLVQLLNHIAGDTHIDIREIIYLEESVKASHDSQDRPTPDELKEIYKLKKSLCKPVPNKIIIFDDMVTAGSHFCACKSILIDLFPEAEIIGVFFTRRTFLREDKEE